MDDADRTGDIGHVLLWWIDPQGQAECCQQVGRAHGTVVNGQPIRAGPTDDSSTLKTASAADDRQLYSVVNA